MSDPSERGLGTSGGQLWVEPVGRLSVTLIVAVAVYMTLFLVSSRLTVAALAVVWAFLYWLFPLHRSRRALWAAFVLLVLAVLIPFDIYVGSLHGRLYGSQHSGPRLVRVVWGMPVIQRNLDEYGEFISGGCIVRLHDTRWMLVWD